MLHQKTTIEDLTTKHTDLLQSIEKAEKELSRISNEKEIAQSQLDKLERQNLELEADLKNTKRDKKSLE